MQIASGERAIAAAATAGHSVAAGREKEGGACDNRFVAVRNPRLRDRSAKMRLAARVGAARFLSFCFAESPSADELRSTLPRRLAFEEGMRGLLGLCFG